MDMTIDVKIAKGITINSIEKIILNMSENTIRYIQEK